MESTRLMSRSLVTRSGKIIKRTLCVVEILSLSIPWSERNSFPALSSRAS